MRRLLSLALAAALLAAACESGGGPEPTATSGPATTAPETGGPGATTTSPETVPATTGEEQQPDLSAPEAGVVLADFVEAAGSGDAERMWTLLSEPTRRRFGPTRADFSKHAAHDFEEGVGSFAGTDYRLVVAAAGGSGWAAAAIAGPRVAEGMPEHGAYAAALRREADGWRLELGGPVEITPRIPGAGVVPSAAPELSADVVAPAAAADGRLWLDGVELPASVRGVGHAGGTVTGELLARAAGRLEPGPHTVVALVRAGGEATAVAWVVFVAGAETR